MNNTTKALCAIACVAACVGFSVLAHGNFSRTRGINEKRTAIDASNAALREKLRAQDAQTAEAGRTTQSAKAAVKRLDDRVKQFNAYREREDAWKKLVNEDPVLQSRQLVAYRATINAKYGPFFHKMELNPEQREMLARALVQRRMDAGDLYAILAGEGVKPEDADAAWLKAKKETDDAFAAAATEVLGEDGMRQFAHFDSNRRLWSYASRLAGAASRCGIPLTLQQVDRLVDIMAGVSDSRPGWMSFDEPDVPAMVRDLPSREEDWASVDEQSRTFLSKEQFELFRTADVGNGADGRFMALYAGVSREAMLDRARKSSMRNQAETDGAE